MITAEITMSSTYDKTNQMVKWCYDNIGTKAYSRDTVDHEHPWHWSFFDPTFYFAKESDAVWFKLVWA